MKIRLEGNYYLTADSYNYILNQETEVQTGKNKGKKTLYAYGFYPTLNQALRAFINQKVKDCTARTLKGLIKQHRELLDSFSEVFDTAKRVDKLAKKGE